MKKCNKCEVIKDNQFFYKDKSHSDGYRSRCKSCEKKSKNLLKLNKVSDKNHNAIIIFEKKCSDCNLIFETLYFHKDQRSKDLYNKRCKNCVKKFKLNKQMTKIENFNKICEKCLISKNSCEFKINRCSKDNLFSICIDCWPKPIWTKEKQHASEKKYCLNNVEKIKAKNKIQGQKINRKIRNSLNKRISGSLKAKKTYKKNNTATYLGCDILFFKKWIENLFVDGMTWENYGKWELDHVKPCDSFNLEQISEQYECFNWKNIQPLWALDNRTKSNKIDNNLIKTQLNKAEYFSAQLKEGELRELSKVLDTNLS
jgi:hypothetical protein